MLIVLGLSVLAVVGAFAVRALILGSRPDLGFVSERWLAELKADSSGPSH
ncbi:MAG: hypothetical protein O2930_00290 [Acidobacteria bacterium]|nr:hypothetical protein [Acidobacteriota bacterium]